MSIIKAFRDVVLLIALLCIQTTAKSTQHRADQQILEADEPILDNADFTSEYIVPMAAARPSLGNPILDRSKWSLECSSVDPKSRCDNINKVSDREFWRSAATGFPQNLTINLGAKTTISGIAMTPTRGSFGTTPFEGNIAKHEIYVSVNKVKWTLVAYGTWWSDNTEKTAVFEPQTAQWVRLTARSSARDGEKFVNVASLDVFRVDGPAPFPPARAKGQWGATINFPIVPAGAWVDPRTHEVVTFSSYGHDHFDGGDRKLPGRTLTSIWNPATSLVSQRDVTETGHDMFCPGLSFDANGLMLVTGGRSNTEMSIYDSGPHSWAKGTGMQLPRGYQSSVTCGDGRVFLIGGSWESINADCVPKDGEIYDPTTKKWKMLRNTAVKPMWTAETASFNGCNSFRRDNHGWLFPWKNDTVFQAGPSSAMHWYTVSGDSGGIRDAGPRASDTDSMCGVAVMYDAVQGRILTAGGSKTYMDNPSTKNTHVMTIDTVNSTVSPRLVQPMAEARKYHSAVVLPDGDTLVVGGRRAGGLWDNNPNDMVFEPELFSQTSEKWTKMARHSTARVYHSFAILLPDATVLAGGGGLGPNGVNDPTKNHFDAQIYTPPYLLTASKDPAIGVEPAKRPAILKVSSEIVSTGDRITIDTDSDIAHASLIRYGSSTHGLNTDQRRISLTPVPTKVERQYEVTVPPEKGIAIPGYWMLFAMDRDGVPSVAKRIRVRA